MIKHIVLSLMAMTLAMTGMNAVATCPGDGEEVDGSGIGRASLSKKDREGKTGVDNYKYFLDTEGEFVGKNDDEFEYGEGKAKVTFADGQSEYVEVNNLNLRSGIATYSNGGNDSYENNDDFPNASLLRRASAGHLPGQGFVSMEVHGTINQKKSGWFSKYVDKDFYAYDVTCAGNLLITLSVPQNLDLDLRLYKLSNTLDTSYEELDFNETYGLLGTSNKGQGVTESLSVNCFPGTFYIVVYSFNDKTYSDTDKYTLTIVEEANLSSYSIPEAMNKGDLGAIWVSDYSPAGINPATTLNPDENYLKLSNISEYPLLDSISSIYDGANSLTYAVVYVWDNYLREILWGYYEALLQSFLKTYCDEFNNIIEPASKLENTSLILNGVEAGLSWAAVGPTFVSVLPLGFVSKAAGFISAALTAGAVITHFINSIIKEYCELTTFKSSLSQIKDFLTGITAALETTENNKNNEIVMIKFGYRFVMEKEGTYLDWSPLYVPGQQNLFRNTYISRTRSDSPFTGTIKPIKDI